MLLHYRDLERYGEAMIFRMNSNQYNAASAVAIVRELERDAVGYLRKGGTVRDFISWSFLQLDDRLPSRELVVPDNVNDETLSLSFLCLLDQYGVGELHSLSPADNKRDAGLTSR